MDISKGITLKPLTKARKQNKADQPNQQQVRDGDNHDQEETKRDVRAVPTASYDDSENVYEGNRDKPATRNNEKNLDVKSLNPMSAQSDRFVASENTGQKEQQMPDEGQHKPKRVRH